MPCSLITHTEDVGLAIRYLQGRIVIQQGQEMEWREWAAGGQTGRQLKITKNIYFRNGCYIRGTLLELRSGSASVDREANWSRAR